MADASEAVAATSSRLAKIAVLATALHDAGPAEVPIAVPYLSGELPQRQIGVGWASLPRRPRRRPRATLTLTEVDAAFTEIGAAAGQGSRATRKQLLDDLFGRATAMEQTFLRRLLTGELRQGALEGVMADAVAKAAEVPSAEVRRAVMLSGSLAAVAATAITEGREGLRASASGRAAGPPDAGLVRADRRRRAGQDQLRTALEWKLDGIRVQIHRGTARSGSSPAPWTTSPSGCPASWPNCAGCRRGPPCWTAR